MGILSDKQYSVTPQLLDYTNYVHTQGLDFPTYLPYKH